MGTQSGDKRGADEGEGSGIEEVLGEGWTGGRCWILKSCCEVFVYEVVWRWEYYICTMAIIVRRYMLLFLALLILINAVISNQARNLTYFYTPITRKICSVILVVNLL